MYLRRAVIENFRGISRLDLALDGTTVLTGENGCGKSSFLDALCLCFGAFAPSEIVFRDSDFWRPFSGQRRAPLLRMRFLFAEDVPGDWAPWLERLRDAITPLPGGHCQIWVEVKAELPGPGQAAAAVCSFLDANAEPVATAGSELLANLRRFSPVLLIGSAGQKRPAWDLEKLLGTLAANQPENERDRLISAALQSLAKWKGSWDTLSGEEFQAAATASQLLWQRAVDAWLQGRKPSHRPSRTIPGVGLQQMIPLLLTRGWLEARGPGALDPDSAPLAVFDHIESNLHPTVLSALWYAVESLPCQKIITTYSGEILAHAPLSGLRRLVRRNEIEVYRLGRLRAADLQKVSYHIRAKRGSALFARCWLLIEGETEFWLLPELARACGYDFHAEGVVCVEFAQCGVYPLVRLANDLGIDWVLLADGDEAGEHYAASARSVPGSGGRIVRIPRVDIEHLMWHSGYAHVYRAAANRPDAGGHRTERPSHIIETAIRRRSKPRMALAVAEAVHSRGADGVPPVLRTGIAETVRLARSRWFTEG